MVWLIFGVAVAIVVALICFILFLAYYLPNFDKVEDVEFHDSEHKPII